jgi:hypothetical protein
MISSKSLKLCARTLSTAAAMLDARLKSGMTTEIRGPSARLRLGGPACFFARAGVLFSLAVSDGSEA